MSLMTRTTGYACLRASLRHSLQRGNKSPRLLEADGNGRFMRNAVSAYLRDERNARSTHRRRSATFHRQWRRVLKLSGFKRRR